MTMARLRELGEQLNERDRAVLQTVSGLRFVSGAQLVRLSFPAEGTSARTARAALSRLTRLGVLARLPRPVGGVRAGSSGYVYRLGPAGQRLSVEAGWQPAGRPQSYVPGTLFVAHALAVAELHARLVETDRAGRIELIELAGEAASRRRYNGPLGPRVLKPDSFVRLGQGKYEDSYFIEVDMGTEGSRALLAKLNQYAEYEATGHEQAEHGVFPLTLWLVPDAERAAVIADCVGRLPRPARSLFRVAEFTEVEAVMASGEVGGDLPRNEKMETGKYPS
jgi:hypothetical protein